MEEDNKERLLQAAIQLFAEQSFDAVSIRQIASTAQVNSAMISYYFGSKQKLFEAAIAARLARDGEGEPIGLDLATGETVDWIYTDGWLSSVLEGRDPYA